MLPESLIAFYLHRLAPEGTLKSILVAPILVS